MSSLQKENFQKLLSKNGREDIIYNAVIGGWKDYQASSEFNKWKRKGTRASIVWERMIDRALGEFDGAEGINIVERDDTVSFVFDEVLLLRFKKGDSNKISSNYPTSLALSFHKPNKDLFGYEGVRRAEVIYVLNDRETEIESVNIVARNGKSITWEFELLGSNENIIPLPITPQHEVPSKKGIARLKKLRQNENGAEQNKASSDGKD